MSKMIEVLRKIISQKKRKPRYGRIINVSGFGVNNEAIWQSTFLVVALTDRGEVLLARDGLDWHDITPRTIKRAAKS